LLTSQPYDTVDTYVAFPPVRVSETTTLTNSGWSGYDVMTVAGLLDEVLTWSNN